MHEVSILSAFNILVAVFLAAFVIVEIFVNPSERPSNLQHTVITSCKTLNQCTLGGAFASFIFAFGSHPVLPIIYESMAKPKQFNKMIFSSYMVILLFYLPLAIIGYWAFGQDVPSPVYNALCMNDCPTQERVGKIIAVIALTVHVLFSYTVILNPSELALERALGTDNWSYPKLWSVVARTVIVLLTCELAILIPDFGDFLGLVSSVTGPFTAYILPCLFYLKLFWEELKAGPRWLMIVIVAFNCLIILISVLGGFYGGYQALYSIVHYKFTF